IFRQCVGRGALSRLGLADRADAGFGESRGIRRPACGNIGISAPLPVYLRAYQGKKPAGQNPTVESARVYTFDDARRAVQSRRYAPPLGSIGVRRYGGHIEMLILKTSLAFLLTPFPALVHAADKRAEDSPEIELRVGLYQSEPF